MSVLYTHVNVSHICVGALGGQKSTGSSETEVIDRCDPSGKPAHNFGYEGKKKQEHVDNACQILGNKTF